MVVGVLAIPSIRLQLPFFREQAITSFVRDACIKEAFPTAGFWQLRNHLTLGAFKPDFKASKAVGVVELQQLTPPETTIAQIDSPRVQSRDGVTLAQPFELYLQQQNLQLENVICQKSNFIITRTASSNQPKIHIIFATSIDEMRKVNGLLDYLEPERELLENQMWVNDTTLQ